MKNNLWKPTVMVVLIILVSGLAMLLAGCGPEEETPTPVLVKPTATPVPAAPPTDTPVPPPAETEIGDLVDDFEGGDFDDHWWSYTGEGTVSFACTPDQPGHASAQAMQLTFEVGAGSYVNCGIDVDPGHWADVGGLGFGGPTDRA